jgi:hypothetical protein
MFNVHSLRGQAQWPVPYGLLSFSGRRPADTALFYKRRAQNATEMQKPSEDEMNLRKETRKLDKGVGPFFGGRWVHFTPAPKFRAFVPPFIERSSREESVAAICNQFSAANKAR